MLIFYTKVIKNKDKKHKTSSSRNCSSSNSTTITNEIMKSIDTSVGYKKRESGKGNKSLINQSDFMDLLERSLISTSGAEGYMSEVSFSFDNTNNESRYKKPFEIIEGNNGIEPDFFFSKNNDNQLDQILESFNAIKQKDLMTLLSQSSEASFIKICLNAKGFLLIDSIIKQTVKYDDCINKLFSYLYPNEGTLLKNETGIDILCSFIKNNTLFDYLNSILYDYIYRNCYDVATGEVSYKSIYKFYTVSNDVRKLNLLRNIAMNSLGLSIHPIGHLIILYVIDKRNLQINDLICSIMQTNLLLIATNQFSSIVLIKLLENCSDQIKYNLCSILTHQKNVPYLFNSPYGYQVFMKVYINPKTDDELSSSTSSANSSYHSPYSYPIHNKKQHIAIYPNLPMASQQSEGKDPYISSIKKNQLLSVQLQRQAPSPLHQPTKTSNGQFYMNNNRPNLYDN